MFAIDLFTDIDAILIYFVKWTLCFIYTSNIMKKYPFSSCLTFYSENNWTRISFARPRVLLTRNNNFKMAVNLLESKLYL